MPMSGTFPTLRLGTRGSLLARTQSQLVANALEQAHPGLRVELVAVRTTGDRITDRPLHDVGGKGLFTKELEQGLLAGEIDFAVHSFKDVPVTMPLVDQTELVIAAVPRREDSRDVMAVRDASATALPGGARVGTSSLRRRCQLLETGGGYSILPLRGNIDTRLRKLRDSEYDAIVLAMAGLLRAGLYDASFMRPLEPEMMLPAPGQGALALQCRGGDERTVALLRPLNDPDTAQCVDAERAVVAALEGDCHSPIAALATVAENGRPSHVHLRVAVGARDGVPPVLRASSTGAAPSAVEQVIQSLAAAGVHTLLHGPA
jgi:hydroxymethylbilane synthase